MKRLRPFLCAGIALGFLHLAALADPSPREIYNILVPNLGEIAPEVHLEYRHEPEQGLDQTFKQTEQSWYGMDINAVLFPSYTDRSLTLQFQSRMRDIGTNMLLPSTPGLFPDPFMDIGLGGVYRTQLPGGRLAGVQLSISSRSDFPFNDGRDPVVQSHLFYRLPRAERDAWLLYIHYLSNREYARNIPLPGAAYLLRRAAHNLEAEIGWPYARLQFDPTPKTLVRASYLFPRELESEIGWRVTSALILHADLDYHSERYARRAQHDHDRMMTYRETRTGGGIRYEPSPGFFFDVTAGYASNRHWYEGEDYGDRNFNRINLDGGWYGGFEFNAQL